MTNNDIPDAIKRQLIQQKVSIWRNTLYDTSVDARLADLLKDEAGKQAAATRAEQAIRALDELERILAEIPAVE